MSEIGWILVGLLLVTYATFVWFIWRDANLRDVVTFQAPTKRKSAEGRVRERVLFVCTHNSARSQMAEALLRDFAGDEFDIASAGTAPTSVHPLAEAVMAERGLSLRSHRSKPLSEVSTRWDYVITLCDRAFEDCPDFPAKTSRLHWSIEDPNRPAATPEEQLDAFCRVRDDLAVRLRRWVAERQETP
jgi:arsenate reductase